jgi:two-component system OmpR family sensor kinase
MVRADVHSFVFVTAGGPPSMALALANNTVMMPEAEFAALQSDGTWLMLRSTAPLLSAWHLKILAGFFGCALVLVPIAWLVARRLSLPMRELARQAQDTDLEDSSGDVRGPRELRQIASALKAMRDRLNAQVEERIVMLAAVAHDLRTPLTALRIRSERAKLADRGRMIADIGRMEKMIAQFLDFARLSHGDKRSGDVDFAGLVAAVVQDVAADGGLVTHRGERSLLVSGDPTSLERMVRNLIDNAVRFGKQASVDLTSEDEHAVLTVCDQGPGIPPAELTKVFQPFYRLDASRGADGGGVGLGLAIVRAIARAHGGDATLRPGPTGGLEAQVRIALPNR